MAMQQRDSLKSENIDPLDRMENVTSIKMSLKPYKEPDIKEYFDHTSVHFISNR
jgi:hypothetical protein